MTLLETIERLSTRARSTSRRSRTLDVGMRGDPENAIATSRDEVVSRAAAPPPELRVPLEGATRKDGLLILDLDPEQERIDEAQVKHRFGDDPELELPTPEQPADAPIYLSYAKPWGALRFGFARPSKEFLTTIVIDADRGSADAER
jgi:hypothetical protein